MEIYREMIKMKIRPSEISVGRRFREELGNLNDLDNIKDLGLLQPIGITKDKKLVFGERRLRKWKQIHGDKPIPTVIVEPKDELGMRVMELRENAARKNLTWQEEAEAIAEIDRLGREIHGERPKGGRPRKNRSDSEQFWSTEKTAGLLGISKGKVSDSKALARGMEEDPELRELETEIKALTRIRRRNAKLKTVECWVCEKEVPKSETKIVRICKGVHD